MSILAAQDPRPGAVESVRCLDEICSLIFRVLRARSEILAAQDRQSLGRSLRTKVECQTRSRRAKVGPNPSDEVCAPRRLRTKVDPNPGTKSAHQDDGVPRSTPIPGTKSAHQVTSGRQEGLGSVGRLDYGRPGPLGSVRRLGQIHRFTFRVLRARREILAAHEL